MRKLLLLVANSFFYSICLGQFNNSIEISVLATKVKNPNTITIFAGRAINNTNNLNDNSYDAASIYRVKIIKRFYFFVGIDWLLLIIYC